MSSRAIVIHGHFYQPPRENPWLEAVEVQDSAAPFHDWNARVTAECYAPNTAARRVTDDNRIHHLVNNFEKISFNVGPTLLSWLEGHAPDVYAKILDADRASLATRGHGNALAQVYNHMIMPLASTRDRVTQVRWGLADFRTRFVREPQGMWLPETAVDAETLNVLAEHGIAFTILAPHQARRIRKVGEDAWSDVGDAIDPSRPYLWRGQGGRSMALFFYDGPISRAIAFEGALARGETLVGRLRGGFSDARDWPQIVHCATDGESYGHHAKFGDMALAAAVQQIERESFAELTNYAAALASHPPAYEVEIRERTSWSCAHGVERWRSDCGCRVHGATHQRWRAPLRDALDWLRDQIDPWFETRAGELLKDPWAARDEYVEVVLDRRLERLDAFVARHQRATLDEAATVEARRLMELQRNRLLMYTSCGWFFDELSGLEPVQILKYAAMAMQYVHHLGGPSLEPEFIRRLEAAPTNNPALPHGGEVYRRLIGPAVVDPTRVVAHYAITGLLDEQPEQAQVYAFGVERLDTARESWDTTALRVGHVRVRSDVTGEATDATFAVLHFGGHDFTCGVRPFVDAATYERMKRELFARYAEHSVADVVRAMDEWFAGSMWSLSHLFLEERRRVLASLTRAVVDRHEETYRRIWEENRKLVHYLRQSDAPIPDPLAMIGRHVLATQALDLLGQVPDRGAIPPEIVELVAEARRLGFTLDLSPAREAMRRAIAGALDRLRAAATSESGEDVARRSEDLAERLTEAVALVAGARELSTPFGLWATQNRFFELWHATPSTARATLTPLADLLGFALPVEPA